MLAVLSDNKFHSLIAKLHNLQSTKGKCIKIMSFIIIVSLTINVFLLYRLCARQLAKDKSKDGV